MECKYVYRLEIVDPNPTTCPVAAHEGQNLLPAVTTKNHTFVTGHSRQWHPHR
jgi:hypothetical protein